MRTYQVNFTFIGAPITVHITTHNEYYARIVLNQMLSEYLRDVLGDKVEMIEV
jgi:hypothetical protein